MFRPLARPLLALIIGFLQLQLSLQQQQCSESQLCEIGCCSSSGYCGYGPEFCGDGCLSGCDRKADCNPGWDSTEWSLAENCPLNVCCSEFGFCGLTEEFCGHDDEIDRPSCSISDTKINRVIGYFEAWSTTQRSCYSMLPEEIPFGHYTHINFAFATINPETFEITPGDSLTASYMDRIRALKMFQPDLEIWVAVGGWTFNDPGPTATTFSDMASSEANTDAFIDSLIKMMNKYNLDGLDLDWEYPVARDRSGRDEDFDNFVTMMERIQKTLRAKGFKKGLSLTLPSSYWYLQHFDIKRLQDHVDWFNIMSYDVHGSWDIDNDWTGPYANAHTNMTEIQTALDLLWRNDIDPDKVVMGMAYYTRSFTLVDPACNTPGCLVASAGVPGECSGTVGVLLHGEIQEMIEEHDVTPVLDRDAAVKTVSWGNQWVSFDDVATWRLKANIAREQCISGVMVWAISQDDSDGTNAKALTSALGRTVMDIPDWSEEPIGSHEGIDDVQTCRWTGCGKGCPSGFKEVKRDGTDQIMSDHTFCPNKGQVDKFCCPADLPMPTCRWRGHHNSGVCTPGCEDDEVTVGSLRHGCNISHQSACCTAVASTLAYGQCKWVGSAPTCKLGGGPADCPDDFPKRILSTTAGSGGEQGCVSGTKSYCCTDPGPAEFTNCKWYRGPENKSTLACTDVCPDGQIKLATRAPPNCLLGAEAYCCDPPEWHSNEPRDDDFGSISYRGFVEALIDYMEDPTCPAEELGIMPGDIRKRSLVSPAPGLQRRDGNCVREKFFDLVASAAIIFKLGSEAMGLMGDAWDEYFAKDYDELLMYDPLSEYFDTNPYVDVYDYLQKLLLNPIGGAFARRQEDEIRETFCESPSSNARRDINPLLPGDDFDLLSHWSDDDVDTEKRTISPSGRFSGQPTLRTVLDGIINSVLVLTYARWQWYTGSGSAVGGRPSGPMLEIAYRIPAGLAGDSFRDSNHASPPDEWIVFHFHFEPQRPGMLAEFDGNTYVGAAALSMYHGHTLNPNPQDGGHWRVENTDTQTRNERTRLTCRNGSLWYLGRRLRPEQVSNRDLRQDLYDWTVQLFNGGYVSTMYGLDLIFPQAQHRGENQQIDPANSGPVIRDGNHNYTVNWVVSFDGQWDEVPNPPP